MPPKAWGSKGFSTLGPCLTYDNDFSYHLYGPVSQIYYLQARHWSWASVLDIYLLLKLAVSQTELAIFLNEPSPFSHVPCHSLLPQWLIKKPFFSSSLILTSHCKKWSRFINLLSKSSFSHNSFIDIQFTYHTTHPLKVCSSNFFSIFTKLCHHHHNFRMFSSIQKETSYPLAVNPYFSPTPQH